MAYETNAGLRGRYQSSVRCEDTNVFADEVTSSTCLYLVIDFYGFLRAHIQYA
jgi:hypothetical protein